MGGVGWMAQWALLPAASCAWPWRQDLWNSVAAKLLGLLCWTHSDSLWTHIGTALF